jgi:hypothetical protein
MFVALDLHKLQQEAYQIQPPTWQYIYAPCTDQERLEQQEKSSISFLTLLCQLTVYYLWHELLSIKLKEVQVQSKIFGGQCHSFWIIVSYIGTKWRLMREKLGFDCGFVG